MKNEAVILAGGAGSRLAPITDDIPKPLVPIAGIPVLERLTGHLKANGFDRALLTVYALPEAFRAYSDPNVALTVYEGSLPAGSAGCLAEVGDLLAETVLVVSGDTVTDIDLRSAWEKHRRERRKATILLTRSETPGEFGVVTLRENGTVAGFSEKPSWRDTASDLVSTGIYILDRKTLLSHLPEGVCWEFGRDFFPQLLKEGVEIYGEALPGRWWDVGTPESFYACSMAFAADGEDGNCTGAECVIDAEAKVSRCVLMDRVRIGASRVEGSILCRGVRVGDGCVIPPGCLLGQNTVLEDGVTLRPGVKLKGGLIVHADATVDRSGVFGRVSKGWFGDETIEGTRETLDSAFCLRLGRALKPVGASLRLGVLHNASAAAKLYAGLVSMGARDAGATVWELGEGFPAVISCAVRAYDLDAAVFVELRESVGSVRFRFCDRLGLPLAREVQRGIEKRLGGGALSTCFTPSDPVIPAPEDRVLFRYCNWLQEQVGGLSGVRFSVSRRDDAGEFLYANAKKLGADVSYSVVGDCFTVSPDGRRAGAVTASGKELTYWHLIAIAAAESPDDRLGLPVYAPDVVVRYLRNMGKTVLLFSDVSDGEPRRASLRNPYLNDGVLLCLTVLSRLKDRGVSLDGALSALPAFAVRKKTLPAARADEGEDHRASRIAALIGNRGFPARVFWKNGCVSFFPNALGGYTLLAEAADWETASELCVEAEKML